MASQGYECRRPLMKEFRLRTGIDALESPREMALVHELLESRDGDHVVVWLSLSIYLLCASIKDDDPLAGR